MTELNLKILIVGDSNVGKTSILLKYIDGKYPDEHVSTIGVEHKIKNFEYKGFKVRLQIWDTVGQERFHSITYNYFHNSDGIIFVYDITNHKSFEGVKNWIKEAEEFEDSFEKILLGNKCDLIDQREVTKEEVEDYCNEKNIELFETSAKIDINLNEVFDKIIELIFNGKTKEEIIKSFGNTNSSLSILSKNSYKSNKKKKNKKNEKCC